MWNNEDISVLQEEVLSSIIPRTYDAIAVIDLNQQAMVFVLDKMMPNVDWTGQVVEYQGAMMAMVDSFLAPEEGETYLFNADINTIRHKLEKEKIYMYTQKLMTKDGKSKMKLFEYFYLDKEAGLVVTTTEDKSAFLERDTLTGEYNRHGFISAAKHVIRSGEYGDELAILYINIRGFRAVNDLFGVEEGDRVLRSVPYLLRSSSLNPYIIGRLSADHFVCLVNWSVLDEKHLSNLLSQTFVLNNHSIEIHGICGIYMIQDKTLAVNEMCDAAQLALSYIDDEYVRPFAIFDKGMQRVFREKAEVQNALRGAFEKGEFRVFYQPVYDVKTGDIASAEALVRWYRGDKGMVSPGVFIPCLEESGQISQMDLFVERSVLSFLADRQKDKKFMVPVSINMSQMDFYDEKLMTTMMEDITNTQLPRDYTRFEVTETAYANVVEHKGSILGDFRNMGIKFYLDDFGSGYSSFSSIRDYDFDVIKLDMGFVQKIGTSDRADGVIHSIISMAHLIGSKVVAEGVEEQSQFDFLVECGCDFIQGYYFSKPLPEEEFARLLDEAV